MVFLMNKERTPLALKISTEVFREMETMRKKLPIEVTRTAFIEAAIREKVAQLSRRK